jgi:amino acid transporter
VEEAFGSKAGLLCGYFHWVSGATDNAIYPSLFLEYLAEYAKLESGSNVERFFFCVVMTIILAVVNWTGLEIVGNLSLVVAITSMSPFILLCIIGIKDVDYHRWFIMPEQNVSMDDDAISGTTFLPSPTWGGVLWRPFVNSLFWNLNSFDVGASFAGEVRDPERVFPRAMFLSAIFVCLSYILPLGIALGATDSKQQQWSAGYLVTAASNIGGNWLGAWTLFASAISNIALFEAEMSGDAYQLMGMADRGLIPKVFTRRSRFGTPTNGILVGTAVIFCLSVADFDALVEMLNFSLCLSMLMEFSAFVKLRITDGDHDRPYRIPLNTFGCILFIIPPCTVCIVLMLYASKMTYVYFTILVCFGAVAHLLQKIGKHHDWWEYAVAPPKKTKSKKLNPAAPV